MRGAMQTCHRSQARDGYRDTPQLDNTPSCAILQASRIANGSISRQIDSFDPFAVVWRAASTGVTRSAAGASRGVPRGASLGEATSAGAVNSQRTLHAATRPPMTAFAEEPTAETCHPAFAVLTAESSVCSLYTEL